MKDKQLRKVLIQEGIVREQCQSSELLGSSRLPALDAATDTLHKKVELILEYLGLKIEVKDYDKRTDPYILVKKETANASNK